MSIFFAVEISVFLHNIQSVISQNQSAREFFLATQTRNWVGSAKGGVASIIPRYSIEIINSLLGIVAISQYSANSNLSPSVFLHFRVVFTNAQEAIYT